MIFESADWVVLLASWTISVLKKHIFFLHLNKKMNVGFHLSH